MTRLFGTDGIRGVAGEPPLDAETVYRIGFCLVEYLKSLDPQPRILIARDTRESGPWLEALLERAVADAGGRAEPAGVLSTPAVSLLTIRTGAAAGIMISASHNPYQDNGIKLFASTGMKFTDAVEDDLEARIRASRLAPPPELAGPRPMTERPLLDVVPEFNELYRRFLLDCVAPDFRLDGMHLAVDCGHGSLSALAPPLLRELGAGVETLHVEPDGRNINREGGALHLERLREHVGRSGAELGIAFDGDADRAMFVDRDGRTRDGDDVLYLMARFLDFTGAPRKVVGTVMSNLGLELALGSLGFELVRTPVGDRNVLEEMLRLGAVVGGEQSGHVILLRLAPTGDGLLTALKVLEILRGERASLADLCAPVVRFPQVLLNVRVREKVPLEAIPGLGEAEEQCRRRLGPRSRILIRYSGTEKLARVMVEGEQEDAVRASARRLAAVLEAAQS